MRKSCPALSAEARVSCPMWRVEGGGGGEGGQDQINGHLTFSLKL